jgi:HPt (histidine-containing phosphotransfer) domain-containing protein
MRTLDGALRKWIRPGSAPARRGAPLTPSQLSNDHPLRVLEAQGRAAVVVEVIDLFLQTTPLRIEALRSAHGQGDTAAVLSLGHSLKGAAFQLGARALAELCQRVQAEVREGTLEELGRLLDALEAEFDSVSVVLKSERDRLSQRRI